MAAKEYLRICPKVNEAALASFNKYNQGAGLRHLFYIYWMSRRVPKEIAYKFRQFRIHLPPKANLYVNSKSRHLMFVDYESGEIVYYYHFEGQRQREFEEHLGRELKNSFDCIPIVAKILDISVVTRGAWEDYIRIYSGGECEDMIARCKNGMTLQSLEMKECGLNDLLNAREYRFDGKAIYAVNKATHMIISCFEPPERAIQTLRQLQNESYGNVTNKSADIDVEGLLRYQLFEN